MIVENLILISKASMEDKRNSLMDRRMIDLEESYKELKDGCKVVCESVIALSRSLKCMQGVIVSEIRRLIEKFDNEKPCDYRNKVKLNIPNCRIPLR